MFHPDSERDLIAESRGLLLTPGEAAALLHTTTVTLRNWRKKGKLRYVTTPSGQFRYPKSAVRALMEGRPQDATP